MHIRDLIAKLKAAFSLAQQLTDNEHDYQDFQRLVMKLSRELKEIKELYANPANITSVTDFHEDGLAAIIQIHDDEFLHANFVLRHAIDINYQIEHSDETPESIMVPCAMQEGVAEAGQVLVRAFKKSKAYQAIFAGSSWKAVGVEAQAGSILELSNRNIERLKQELFENVAQLNRQLVVRLAELGDQAMRLTLIDLPFVDFSDAVPALGREIREVQELLNEFKVQVGQGFAEEEALAAIESQYGSRLTFAKLVHNESIQIIHQIDADDEIPAWIKVELETNEEILPRWLLANEVDLYRTLLGLPYELKHATNGWYRILNDGRLDSYAEIQRRDPSWTSEFSTNGNIRALGNGGFVFFRVECGPGAMHKTRYGETQISYPISLIGGDGWISLYDQLKPLSSNSMKRLYTSQDTLVRQTEVSGKGDIYLTYTYGKAELSNVPVQHKAGYKGKQKFRSKQATSFTEEQTYNDLTRRDIPFTHFVFHGAHAPLGIALSVLYELRHLQQGGFRAQVLKKVARLRGEKLNKYVGDLVVKLFRPEAKLPVALRFFIDTQPASISKPEGDKRYSSDGSVNEEPMAYVDRERRYGIVQDELRKRRRLKGRLEKKRASTGLNQKEQESVNQLNIQIGDLESERDAILAVYQFQDGHLWERQEDGKTGMRFGVSVNLR